jgi:hypothetical protein
MGMATWFKRSTLGPAAKGTNDWRLNILDKESDVIVLQQQYDK